MAKRYRTGTKNQVIRSALMHALDDRESMVDGYRNPHYDANAKPDDPHYSVIHYEFRDEDLEYINKVKAEIADFKQMLESLRGKA